LVVIVSALLMGVVFAGEKWFLSKKEE